MSRFVRRCLLGGLLLLGGGAVLDIAYAGVTVSLTAPVNGFVANANSSYSVSATASATQGYAVSKVEFFLGTTLIGTATATPYAIAWYVTQPPGNYTVTAKVTAVKGSSNQTAVSSPVNITINGAPAVSVSIAPNQIAFAYPPSPSITLTAIATDSDGIHAVSFHVLGPYGEAYDQTLTQPPYTVTLQLGPMFPVFPYYFEIDVAATDSRGATGFGGSGVYLTSPPAVSISAPTQNATFNPSSTINVAAAASDSDGSVSKVEFFANGNAIGAATSAPFSINWSNVAAGTYNLTARATDDLGVPTTSAPVSIVINAAPTVSLTSPAQNATFNAPATVTLTAQASDSDGSLASVAFYNGEALITTVTTPPYTFTWSGVPLGAYSLTAVATDNLGAIATSAQVNVTVNAGVAKLYFIAVDHLNTPRLITDSQQREVWRWDQQEPFGSSPADENPSGLGLFDLPLRLPGQTYDKETGLHYNYYRDFDPSLGSYKQSDLIGLRGGLNTYSYAHASPVFLRDPFGLQAAGAAAGGAMGGGAVGGNQACCKPKSSSDPFGQQGFDAAGGTGRWRSFWPSWMMSESSSSDDPTSAIPNAPVPPYPGLKELSDCTPGQLLIEPAVNKRYRGGVSIQQEYFCPCGQITRHTIVVGGVVVHDHFRPGPPKVGGDD